MATAVRESSLNRFPTLKRL